MPSTLATNKPSKFGSYYVTFECHAITWTAQRSNASDRGRTIKGETLTFYCCEREDVSPVDLAIMTRQTSHKQRWPVVSMWLSQRTRLLAVQRPWLGFQNSSFSLAWNIHLMFYSFFHLLVLICCVWFKDILSNHLSLKASHAENDQGRL